MDKTIAYLVIESIFLFIFILIIMHLYPQLREIIDQSFGNIRYNVTIYHDEHISIVRYIKVFLSG